MTADLHRTPGKREQAATRVAFLVIGLAMSSWAPLVPLAKGRLALDEARLGVLLLCLGLGSVLVMPMSGGLAAKFGCRRVILAAGAVGLAALPAMATANSAVLLGVALALFGAGVGTVDVVMNIQAVIVERASGRPMMSGFHGLYSLGGILGAGSIALLLSLGQSPTVSVLAIVGLCAMMLVGFAGGLLPYGSEEKSPAFVMPHGRVLLIGALCFVLFLAEGSVLDWSGVLLSTLGGLAKERAGIGYAAFSLTMTIGRLTGDRVVAALGSRQILVLGGLVAAAGFALSALVPYWPVSTLGYALVGVGASNAVPVLFTAAGRQRAMPSNLAVAAVTTLGYAGILSGPALIGFVARGTTLPIALVMVSALLIGVAISARAATAE